MMMIPMRVVHQQTTSTTRKGEGKNIMHATHLIFALEDENVGDASKRNAQVDDFSLRHVVGDVSDMDDPRRLGWTSRLQLDLSSHHDARKRKTTKSWATINLQSVPHGIQSSHFLVHRGNNKNQSNSTTLPPLNNLP